MVCPECQLSNPEGTVLCLKCKTPLESTGSAATATEEMRGVSDAWTGMTSAVAPAPSPSGVPMLQVGTVFGGRYEILQLLGEGGMGAVYKARDLEVDRLVALKVIRPELAGQPQVLRRFKQELLLSSKITHKNVIRIYDLGQAEGVKYISMEFIEGQDLRALLRAKQKLAPEEAVRIVKQVCSALEAAHAEGVIHRDLKPHNVMVDQNGKVCVMDFGIAHSMEASGLTQTGALLGTPQYMSPEQARGAKIDQRSDLFALGLILHELLTGKIPFESETMLGTLLRRTQERVTPPADTNPEIPRYLSDVVVKCLATDAADRYQSAAEVLQDLEVWLPSGHTPLTRVATRPGLVAAPRWRRLLRWKWVIAAAAVLVLALAAFLVRDRFAAKVTPPSGALLLLVADFNNATGDPVFNGTLEPTLITALEGASFIGSVSRDDARRTAAELQPAATKMDEALARLVASRQGVPYVVSGSIDRRGDGYQLSVRAINVVAGKLLLTDTIEVANKKGVLVGVGKLAARVRNALGDDTPESLQLAAAETYTAASLEAAQSYALGQRLRFEGQYENAIPHYLRAIEQDPNFAIVYTVLGMTNRSLGRQPEALKYYQMAMARLDRMSDREKYRTRGAYYLAMLNPQKAIEEFSALVKQYPADMAGLNNLALAYNLRHDVARALEEGRRALQVHPYNLVQRDNVAQYAVYAGDFETAVREERAVLQRNPAYYKAYRVIAAAELARGRVAEAVEAFRRLEAGTPPLGGPSYSSIGLADLFLYEGRPDEAVAILEKTVDADLEKNNPAAAARKFATLAQAQLFLGRRAPAVAAADRAVELGSEVSVLFTAAAVYLDAGQEAKARALVTKLANRLESDPQAFAKLLEGEALLKRGNAREAIKLFQESQKLADTWLGRFHLGRAYVEAGAFTEADSELELCLKRRGEATEAFLGQMPTYRYFPPVYYYQGRAREGLHSPSAAESYKAFLSIKEKAVKDPLVEHARRRLALAGR